MTPRLLIHDKEGSCCNIQYLFQYSGMKPIRIHGLLNIQLKQLVPYNSVFTNVSISVSAMIHVSISVSTNENSLFPHLQHSDTGYWAAQSLSYFLPAYKNRALYLQIHLKTTGFQLAILMANATTIYQIMIAKRKEINQNH